ncbi:unnamed protein product [Miscanthus lutarioriparius]|nr:unnamed protein product [Miscanthus lutarioriparius]
MALDGLDHLVSRCPSVLKDAIRKLNTGDSTAFAQPTFVVPKSDMHLEFLSLLESKERTDVTFQKRKQGERNDGDANVMWQQLLVAADRYGVQGLRLACERRLGSYINTNTVATILALAEQHHCRRLKEECLDFPAHLKQVMAVGGLDHLRSICPSVLIDLVAKLTALKHNR